MRFGVKGFGVFDKCRQGTKVWRTVVCSLSYGKADYGELHFLMDVLGGSNLDFQGLDSAKYTVNNAIGVKKVHIGLRLVINSNLMGSPENVQFGHGFI